jgi:hypothetical protein
MDWCVNPFDKDRSSKFSPVTVTEQNVTQTYDKAKGSVNQGTDKRWTSTNGNAEYVSSYIGPPQIGTISMKDGILLVQVGAFLHCCGQTYTTH